jgi:hypothetical protein
MAQADVATDPTSQIKIAFGGGGETDDEYEVLTTFAAWVGEGRVLYVPLAMDPPYDPVLAWAVEALGSVNVRDVVTTSSPDPTGR